MKVAVVVSVLALSQPFVSASSELAFCASDNTGASFKAVTDTFQSNGACIVSCAQYAFGVLQGKKCWCTNVAPSKGSQAETSDCDASCPGYPDDSCGSAGKGVFAYLDIGGHDVTSTAGGSTSSTSTSSSSSSSSSSTSSTTSNESTTTAPVRPIVETQTNSGGQVKTITVEGSRVTADPGSSSGSGSASEKTDSSDSSKLSGGSIAGIVIGVIGGLALVGALIFLVFVYRKRARAASPIPSQDMTDRTSRGSSFMGGFLPRGNGDGVPGRSGTTFTDRRMKTNTVLYPNGARDSSISLQDNEDYSRPVLRLTNPD
ncbi:Carbohydrate-binding WSC subgroup [Penicillium paradoxum]|uniref:Carbohydrate-binding WSC subgroup n=1 Tax=Penicillium paradoxum TaxID=176176 RepID=UPI0025468018|nr:Carbohydrate-binding WSC subgroup [Penicillium paradoxum]KAJ5795119.1 Carbohydrate-binding WSC subgroup [Penicillium paradoxum]